MARLEGTGKDPLGRYGKGEVFDVPKYVDSPYAVHDTDGDRVVNSAYQELLDKGWAKEVKPEDDPGRTVSQMADHVVATGGSLPLHPVEAAIAEKIDDPYAIVHTGDPNASDSTGTLKPKAARDSQKSASRQSGPAELEDEESDDDESGAAAKSSRSRSGSGS